jgi:uncharacterized membrane protein
MRLPTNGEAIPTLSDRGIAVWMVLNFSELAAVIPIHPSPMPKAG